MARRRHLINRRITIKWCAVLARGGGHTDEKRLEMECQGSSTYRRLCHSHTVNRITVGCCCANARRRPCTAHVCAREQAEAVASGFESSRCRKTYRAWEICRGRACCLWRLSHAAQQRWRYRPHEVAGGSARVL